MCASWTLVLLRMKVEHLRLTSKAGTTEHQKSFSTARMLLPRVPLNLPSIISSPPSLDSHVQSICGLSAVLQPSYLSAIRSSQETLSMIRLPGSHQCWGVSPSILLLLPSLFSLSIALCFTHSSDFPFELLHQSNGYRKFYLSDPAAPHGYRLATPQEYRVVCSSSLSLPPHHFNLFYSVLELRRCLSSIATSTQHSSAPLKHIRSCFPETRNPTLTTQNINHSSSFCTSVSLTCRKTASRPGKPSSIRSYEVRHTRNAGSRLTIQRMRRRYTAM